MKRQWIIVILVFGLLVSAPVLAQDQQAEIDSLVTLMRTAGREWNDYADPLIKIGEHLCSIQSRGPDVQGVALKMPEVCKMHGAGLREVAGIGGPVQA